MKVRFLVQNTANIFGVLKRPYVTYDTRKISKDHVHSQNELRDNMTVKQQTNENRHMVQYDRRNCNAAIKLKQITI